MKLLLHHILSGKELAVKEEGDSEGPQSPLAGGTLASELIHVQSIGNRAARSGISKLQKSLDYRLQGRKLSLDGVPLPDMVRYLIDP